MSLLCQLATVSALQADMPAPESWLGATERTRLSTLGTPARRETFLAARWLARRTVQRWRGSDRLPVLEVAPGGACRVVDPDGVFASISHSGDRVACAVAAVPVGVDIERLDRPRDHLAVARAVHGEAQQQALLDLPPEDRARHFLTLWTLKEAWLKARESGLDFAVMRSLAFDDVPDGDPDHDLATAEDGGFLLALAAVPALPLEIVSSPALSWRRCRARRLAPD